MVLLCGTILGIGTSAHAHQVNLSTARVVRDSPKLHEPPAPPPQAAKR